MFLHYIKTDVSAALKTIFFTFIFTLIYLFSDQYFFSPSYSIEKPVRFYGNQFFNPYQNLSLTSIYPINLHGHTNAWGGITNGNGNADTVLKRYSRLGYSLSTLSNYQLANKTIHSNFSISVYEHGYNINKTHQLIIGGRGTVVWKDYIFAQNLSQKQHILSLLSKDTNSVIALAHPGIREGYSIEDIKLLENYHLLEGLRPRHNFLNYWDTALTYGHPITLIGSDDFHNINDSSEIGNHLTMLFDTPLNEISLKNSLLYGQCAVASLNHLSKSSLEVRRNKINRLQNLINFIDLKNQSISISANEPVKFVWKSNNGVLKKSDSIYNDTYSPKKIDQYVRIEVITTDSICLYFNPLYRTTDGNPLKRSQMSSYYVRKNSNKSILAGISNSIYMTLFSILFISMLFSLNFRPKLKASDK